MFFFLPDISYCVLSFLSSLTVFAPFQSDHSEPELFHDEQTSQVSDRICPQMPKAPPLFWPAPRAAVHQINKQIPFTFSAVDYCANHNDKRKKKPENVFLRWFCSPEEGPCILVLVLVRTEADAAENNTPYWCAKKPLSDLSQNISTPPQSAGEQVSELLSANYNKWRMDVLGDAKSLIPGGFTPYFWRTGSSL